MMQSAGKEIFSISAALKLHFEGDGKQKMQMMNQNSSKKQWICMWVTFYPHGICRLWSEILCEIVLDKYVALCVFVCVCMYTGWDSVRCFYVVFFS